MDWVEDLSSAGAASRRSYPHSVRRSQGLSEQLNVKIDPETLHLVLDTARRRNVSPGQLARDILKAGLTQCERP